MNIEIIFTKSKMVRAKYWEILTKSYLTKIFKSSATNWCISSQNEASLHVNVSFKLKNHFQGQYLFAISRWKIKINNVKVSRNYPPYYPKKLMPPYQDLIFCTMDNITRQNIKSAVAVTLEA